MRWLVLAAVLGCAPAPRPPVPEAAAQVEALGPRLFANRERIRFYEGAAFVSRRAEVLR